MLGPSDFRKCISTNLSFGDAVDLAYSAFLEDRNLLFDYLYSKKLLSFSQIIAVLAEHFPSFSVRIAEQSALWLEKFFMSDPVASGSLNVKDMPVGNALIAGAFITNDSNFNTSISSMTSLFLEDRPISIINVTNGEDLWLSAIAEDYLTVDEGTIVGETPPKPINELLLLPRTAAKLHWQQFQQWNIANTSVLESTRKNAVNPQISKEAKLAIQESDLIVYGSGTQHSSLYPTYLTREITQTISKNTMAPKIFFVNGKRDLDFSEDENVTELIDKAVQYLVGDAKSELANYVTHFYSASRGWDGAVDIEQNEMYGIGITWSEKPVLDATDAYSFFSRVIAQELGHTIGTSEGVVSIVVPIYNELSVAPKFLEQFEAIKSVAGKRIEKVLVDGGSTDGTFEILQSMAGITVTQVQSGKLGRFAALRQGIEMSRGERIVIFHSDNEYDIRDIETLVTTSEAHNNSLIVGSRSHGAGGESNLRLIYGNDKFHYWLSRLGGIIVAAIISIRLERGISDPFCGLFAGRKSDLFMLVDNTGDIDSNVKMLLRTKQLQIPIVQIGVTYLPRAKAAGKKTTIGHGLKALFNSVRSVQGLQSISTGDKLK